tara:strand:+ start:122 stop:544 length:423 start_codon:yes stop_codon:yes gene_type:complete
MTKFLYFRVGTATASEDDEATGSNVYPVENFMGACSGTSDANGAITDDDNAISIFLKPIRKTQTQEDNAGDADPDVIVLACSQYGQRQLLKDLLNKINGTPHDDGFITLFDGYVDKPTSAPTSDIGATGLTIVAAQAAAD